MQWASCWKTQTWIAIQAKGWFYFDFFPYSIVSLFVTDISQEGIFRLTGALSRQNKLKSLISQGLPLNLEDGQFSVHDCASVLKNFLSELPEPLLSDTYYPAYIQISGMIFQLYFSLCKTPLKNVRPQKTAGISGFEKTCYKLSQLLVRRRLQTFLVCSTSFLSKFISRSWLVGCISCVQQTHWAVS